MTLAEFSARYRCRSPKADSCGDAVIIGRFPTFAAAKRRPEDSSHIYEHDDGLAVCLLLTPRAWGYAKARLLAVGFTLLQNGHSEGTMAFDPEDPRQAKAAIEETGVRYRMNISEAERERRTARIKSVRAARESQISSQDSDEDGDWPSGPEAEAER
jgi:hypothetical protein